MSVCLSD
ncbi:hypothetical protein NP493_8349g00003 [Ridgeia piscesae]|nr:hypothetical protein NP493_8349g00003 [Ridgeia piscesae]